MTTEQAGSLHVVEYPQGMNALSNRYIGPLVGNGELTMWLDEEGLMHDFGAISVFPEPRIHWAGRRLGTDQRPMVSFGFVTARPSWDWMESTHWSQRLDPKEGLVTTKHIRGRAEETTESALILDRNLFAVNKSIRHARGSASLTVTYQFSGPRTASLPEGVTITGGGSDEHGAWLDYVLDGVVEHRGRVALWSDRPCEACWESNALHIDVAMDAAGDCVTAYLAFADDRANEMFYKKSGWAGRHSTHPMLAPIISEFYQQDAPKSDPEATIADMRGWTASRGWSGVKAHQAKCWGDFFDRGWIRIPDAPAVQDMWEMGMYATRTQLTKWSIPVAIHRSYFNGQYFHDELAGAHALLSAGHADLVQRCADLRLSVAPLGMQMVDGTGIRLEQPVYEGGYLKIGAMGSSIYEVHGNGEPPQLTWNWFKYAGADPSVLERYYPIFWGTAEFFRRWMVYKGPDGRYFTGRCVDFNESIPAVVNGAATVAAAVGCMTLAARVAEMLGRDSDLVEKWREIAAGLSYEPLTNSRGLLCQYEGDEGVAFTTLRMVKGPFTNGFVKPSDPRVRATVMAALADCKMEENWAVSCAAEGDPSAGNMDARNPGAPTWTWLAAEAIEVIAQMGDGDLAAEVIDELIRCRNNFGSLYECKVPLDGFISLPWFVTSMAQLSAGIAEMFLGCREDDIDLLQAIPSSWRNFEFKLAAHNRTTVWVVVRDGVLSRLEIEGPAEPRRVRIRARFAPEALLGDGSIDGDWREFILTPKEVVT